MTGIGASKSETIASSKVLHAGSRPPGAICRIWNALFVEDLFDRPLHLVHDWDRPAEAKEFS
jgi:hypothetical protein